MNWCKRYCAAALAIAALCALGACATSAKCDSPACAADAAIRTDVEALLGQHPELRPPSMVYVLVHNHVVTLSGQVNTDYARNLAESVARQGKGVTEVVNLIGLDYSSR